MTQQTQIGMPHAWNNSHQPMTVALGPATPVAFPDNTVHEGTQSFIGPHEEAEAQALIDAQFLEMCGEKFTGRACGYMVVVRLYIRPDVIKTITTDAGETVELKHAPMVTAEDRFQTNIGLVVSMGPGCFKNPDGSPRYHGPVPFKTGDWLLFPRSDVIRIDYRGVALGLLKDDKGLMVVQEPSDYKIGNLTNQV